MRIPRSQVIAWALSAVSLLPAVAHAQLQTKPWPSVRQQLVESKVQPGSALERLIRDHQDFSLLRAEESADSRGLPPWLRVLWRRNHPELTYSAADPTGGYPLVLREILEWMMTHQDLLPGTPEDDITAETRAAIGPNTRVSAAATAPRSESDIRINYWNPLKVVAASNNISASGVQLQFYSSDGGSTWGQTSLALQSGDAFHSDPTVDWMSNGQAWSTTLGINGSVTTLRGRVYKSLTDGATWTFDSNFSSTQTSVDKQMMWVDHSATSPYKDNLYVCWHNGAPQFVNRRSAVGGTWGTPIQVSGAESTGTAIGCDVKTNANGEAFVFWPATGNRKVLMAKSVTGGATWGAPVQITTTADSFDISVPAFSNRKALIYVTGGAYRDCNKNLVYAAWTDLSKETGCTAASQQPGTNVNSSCKSRIWFARSTNGGSTWSTPVKINNQASKNDQFNPWMAVDEISGRLAIIYYDTVADAGRKKTHVTYQTSADDGLSWSAATQVTTAQTDETIAGADSGNQYGDYNSLSGIAGKFLPSWTDRRSGAREEIWTAAVNEAPPPPFAVSASAPGFITVKTTYPLNGSANYCASGWLWEQSFDGSSYGFWADVQNSQFIAYAGEYQTFWRVSAVPAAGGPRVYDFATTSACIPFNVATCPYLQ